MPGPHARQNASALAGWYWPTGHAWHAAAAAAGWNCPALQGTHAVPLLNAPGSHGEHVPALAPPQLVRTWPVSQPASHAAHVACAMRS